MTKFQVLENCAYYSDDRINGEFIETRDYVSTDSMLQNKAGIANSENSPSGTLICYHVGDILVANIRPYLKKIWYANKSGGCSPDVLVIRSKPNIDSKFLYYSLFRDDFFNHLMKGAKGTKMPRGDKRQAMEFKIPCFDKIQQQKIALLLSILDSKIELNNRINAELEAMAKTNYDYWFVQFDFPISAEQAASMGTPELEGKPYKSSGGKMVWNEVLKRETPEGWEVEDLYTIANYINGLACQKYRPRNEDDEFLPVIKIREMNDGISSSTEKARLDIPDKYIIDDGDVLFSWSATLDVKIWTEGKGALNQHIFKIDSKKYPRTFYYFELTNYLRHFKMMAELRKTTMGHITIDHLKTSFISVPPIDLVNKIDVKINSILEKIILNKKENLQLASLRDWILPMLMNGQITIA